MGRLARHIRTTRTRRDPPGARLEFTFWPSPAFYAGGRLDELREIFLWLDGHYVYAGDADYFVQNVLADFMVYPDEVVIYLDLAGNHDSFTTIALIDGQDETSYDNAPTGEGIFSGGTGYAALDEITLQDGTVVTVDAVAGGVVTQFTVNTTQSVGWVSNWRQLPQASTTGGGTGFYLVPGGDNGSSNLGFSLWHWKEHVAHGAHNYSTGNDYGTGWLGDDGAGGQWRDHLIPWILKGRIRFMMMDDLLNFAGADITSWEIEEMVRWLKEDLFQVPELNAMARIHPGAWHPPPGRHFEYLSGLGCHYYQTWYGDCLTWVTKQSRMAAWYNVHTIWTLAIATGGDGSSGQEATEGFPAMSDAEIVDYGTIMATQALETTSETGSWEAPDSPGYWTGVGTYDNPYEYFSQPQMIAAIREVSKLHQRTRRATAWKVNPGYTYPTPNAPIPSVTAFTYAVSATAALDMDTALTLPTAEVNDVILVIVVSNYANEYQHTPPSQNVFYGTPLYGWRHFVHEGHGCGNRSVNASGVQISVYARVVDGNEPADVTPQGESGTTWWVAFGIAITGADIKVIMERIGDAIALTSSINDDIPSLNTVQDDSLVFAVWAAPTGDPGVISVTGSGWPASVPANQTQTANPGQAGGATAFFLTRTVATGGDPSNALTVSRAGGTAAGFVGVQFVIPPEIAGAFSQRIDVGYEANYPYYPVVWPDVVPYPGTLDWSSADTGSSGRSKPLEGGETSWGAFSIAVGATDQNDHTFVLNMPIAIDYATRVWIRWYAGGGAGNDHYGWSFKIMDKTETVVLAAADAGGTFQQFAYDRAGGPGLVSRREFSYVNTGVGAAYWQRAHLIMRQDYTFVDGTGAAVQVGPLELEMFYVQVV